MVSKIIKSLLIASLTFYLVVSYLGSVARRNYEEGYKNGMLDEHQRSTPAVDPNRKIMV